MDSKGLQYSPGSAAWYIFLSIEDSSYNSDKFCTELLKNYYVSCVPGIGYGKSCDKFIQYVLAVKVGKELKKVLIQYQLFNSKDQEK